MNEHWLRWLFISCAKHFEDLKGSYNFSVGGESDEDWDLWCDFYLPDSKIKEPSHNHFDISCNIRLVCSDIANSRDAYRLEKIKGYFLDLLTDIPIYRYGLTADDIDNDSTQLGCLRRQGDVQISNFTHVEVGTHLSQAVLSADYTMSLTGEN